MHNACACVRYFLFIWLQSVSYLLCCSVFTSDHVCRSVWRKITSFFLPPLKEPVKSCARVETDARTAAFSKPAEVRVCGRETCESTCPRLWVLGARRVRAYVCVGRGAGGGGGRPCPCPCPCSLHRQRGSARLPSWPALHAHGLWSWGRNGNVPQTAALIKRKVAAPSRWCVASGAVIKAADVRV